MQPIDFVITWVDGADETWRKEKSMYRKAAGDDDREERYRDWGLMRYWFRGVETFAPWVRKIHFVTCGHLPAWLDTDNPKLHIVNHRDFIPEKYLPTFNTNTIEIFLHRIEGLAEHFIYFNDDMFCIDRLTPEMFFKGGKPCDMLAFQPVIANPKNPLMTHLFINNMLVLVKYFNKRENVRKQPGNYFKIGYPPLYFFYNMLELAFPQYTGLYTVHDTYVFCKKTFVEVWEKEEEILSKTASHRFRSEEDVSLYLMREWQKLSGNFVAQNITKRFAYFDVGQDTEKLLSTIAQQKKRLICINDANHPVEFETIKKELQSAFEKILPERSSFERDEPMQEA